MGSGSSGVHTCGDVLSFPPLALRMCGARNLAPPQVLNTPSAVALFTCSYIPVRERWPGVVCVTGEGRSKADTCSILNFRFRYNTRDASASQACPRRRSGKRLGFWSTAMTCMCARAPRRACALGVGAHRGENWTC